MCARNYHASADADNRSILIVYDCRRKAFFYPSDAGRLAAVFDNRRSLWQILEEDAAAAPEAVERLRKRLHEVSEAKIEVACQEVLQLKTSRWGWCWFRAEFVHVPAGAWVTITLSEMGGVPDTVHGGEPKMDALTGLMNRRSFCDAVDNTVLSDPEGAAAGRYAVIYFNVLRFKAINELFGNRRGDRLLQYIADVIKAQLKPGEWGCRIDADQFAVFAESADSNGLRGAPERLLDTLGKAMAEYDLPFETTFNAGIYTTCVETLSADAMMDRAKLAQSSIKGQYTVKYRYYTEELRSKMLSEHEIEGMTATALARGQFKVYYQPQYSHSTGVLVGAEALVRWQHPERGLILPGLFIPIFEKNGFITQLDLYVFEHTCALLRKCMDQGLMLVPVSTNFSRYDVFHPGFIEKLEEIRARYDVPAQYLHIELTETVFIGGSERMNGIISGLHNRGYTIQMDDFGSGYSSLNVLKDTDVDCFKLDMDFLTGGLGSGKGGTILSSVVRMAKWLGVHVIAEGVETREQADFLRSIGCDCMQGYLYAKPMTEEEYLKRLTEEQNYVRMPRCEAQDILKVDFWNPQSMDTLIFSQYAGPAAIFEYRSGQVEILRVNEKYITELGMNQTEKELIESDPLRVFDEENKAVYLNMLERAIQTGAEQACETYRVLSSDCCGREICVVRSSAHVIGRSGDVYLFYATIRNITAERQHDLEVMDNERRFRMASEQINIYYWEYNIITREMRPCFRCMRDLGLPPVLKNYPESAFALGVFPPEIHDLYRSWHRQVAAGVPELEAIMPLTMDRIPFRVRYTTEFDAHGRPIRAYGSAALVKDAAACPSELEKMDAENDRALQLIAQHSDRVVLYYDRIKQTIRFNDALNDQYGMNNSTVEELFSAGRILPESRENAERLLHNIAKGVPYGRETIHFKYREGYFCWLDFKYTTIFDDDKKPTGAFLSYIDITDKVEAIERSKIDGMTGLLNRMTAEEEIRGRVQRGGGPGILLLVDIDNLKGINDTFGHQEGDLAIAKVAGILKKHFRGSDIVGRFGGDEFAVYLEAAADSRKAIEGSVRALLEKMANVRVGGGGRCVNCSIGCAVQMKTDTFEELYRRADKALYHAKRHGKQRYAFYSGMVEPTE